MKIYDYINKNKKLLITAFAVGLAVTCIFSVKTYADRMCSKISSSVIRFHVLANSDSEYDQNLKLKVRDGILEYFGDELSKIETRDEAEKFILKNKGNIAERARAVLAENGNYYSVRVTLGNELYPVRYYNNAVLPAGTYKSLKIVIGEGKGHNWWCVMYPPLCLNGSAVEYRDEKELESVLGKDCTNVIMLSENSGRPTFKFRIIELFSTSKVSKR